MNKEIEEVKITFAYKGQKCVIELKEAEENQMIVKIASAKPRNVMEQRGLHIYFMNRFLEVLKQGGKDADQVSNVSFYRKEKGDLWITRDSDGEAYIWDAKPFKDKILGQWMAPEDCNYVTVDEDELWFAPSVKWEDEEPTELIIIK